MHGKTTGSGAWGTHGTDRGRVFSYLRPLAPQGWRYFRVCEFRVISLAGQESGGGIERLEDLKMVGGWEGLKGRRGENESGVDICMRGDGILNLFGGFVEYIALLEIFQRLWRFVTSVLYLKSSLEAEGLLCH